MYRRGDIQREDAVIYVGNLPVDTRERELDDLFYKYGRIVHIDIKLPARPPAFAFVTFTDSRDAEDAVRYRDGITFGGNRLRVEVRRNNHRADRSRDYGRYDGDDRRRWEDRERRSKRRRDGSYGGGYGGGGGYADRKRDDSDGSHDDTVGHYKGQKGDFIVDNKRGTSYEVRSEVGVGTFGRVLECYDSSSGRTCAIKVVRRIQKYSDSAAIEADVLRDVGLRASTHPGGTDLMVAMLAQFEFAGHFCMVFESLGRSLYDYLKTNDYRPFPYAMVVDFAQQLLAAVDFLHKMNLCHTDLKPENVLALTVEGEHEVENGYGSKVLVPASTRIKVIDFGGATYEHEHKSSIVNTRQYRAPEVILGLGWSMPSDCWSAGCIIAELYRGDLLFATHGNHEHLALMEATLGAFPTQVVDKSPHRKKYFDTSNATSGADGGSSGGFGTGVIAGVTPVRTHDLKADSKRHLRETKPLSAFVAPAEHAPLLCLLRGLLTVDPHQRVSALDALQSFAAATTTSTDSTASAKSAASDAKPTKLEASSVGRDSSAATDLSAETNSSAGVDTDVVPQVDATA